MILSVVTAGCGVSSGPSMGSQGSSANAGNSQPVSTIPANLAEARGTNAVTLTWDAVSNASSYNAYCGTTTPVTKSSTVFTGISSPYNITGLTGGSTYYCTVTSVVNGVESDLSTEMHTSLAVHFTNTPVAVGVIGQSSFSASGAGSANNQITGSTGDPVMTGGKVFVPDSGNARILVFNSLPFNNVASIVGPTADLAVSTNGNVDGQSASHNPQSLAVSPALSLLGVVNANDDGVGFMGWSTIPTTNVIADFANLSGGSPSARVVNYAAQDLAIAGNKLFLADGSYNRILIWDAVPSTSEVDADHVIGQTSFTNAGIGSGVDPTGAFMNNPSGVWSDGSILLVADTANNRVLGWNSLPSVTTAPDFILDTTSGASLNGPTRLIAKNNQLFVCDTGNNRVLIWNTIPTTSHVSPDIVLGQTDLSNSHISANRGGSASNSTLSAPAGLYLYNNILFVSDPGNNRMLLYQGL